MKEKRSRAKMFSSQWTGNRTDELLLIGMGQQPDIEMKLKTPRPNHPQPNSYAGHLSSNQLACQYK